MASSIMNNIELKELFELCGFPENTDLKLLYRATQDGFSAVDFHEKCDEHANVLLIVKSIESNVFGGFTEVGWDSSFISGYKYDLNALLFSFKNKYNQPVCMKCEIPEYAIYNDEGS
jgi:hypothetical protein